MNTGERNAEFVFVQTFGCDFLTNTIENHPAGVRNRGLAVLLGWDVREVEGMTSFHDTNYEGQGKATAAMLDKYDLVLSHVEAPDEASHQADVQTKVESIEHIDRYVVGPVLEKLRTFPQWRILVMPDHPTNIATRKHGYAPSPFAMAGTVSVTRGSAPP